jgi:hypothetical protein
MSTAVGANAGAHVTLITKVKECEPMHIGEKVTNPDSGAASAETLLHGRLLCYVYKY